MPIYPPGTTDLCGACGEGGDAIFNLCTRDEAYSLGNCRFEGANTLKQIGTTLIIGWGIFVGLSRIVIGAHYASDVLFSTGIVLVVTLFLYKK